MYGYLVPEGTCCLTVIIYCCDNAQNIHCFCLLFTLGIKSFNLFRSECFCGETPPPPSAKTTEESCDMKCPGDPSKICGGYFTMNIFETGLASEF